jgi:integrase
MTKLTKDNVRTLRAGPSGDALYPDTDQRNGVSGLYLRVRQGGSRTYIVQWRQGQVQRRTTIGKASVLELDDARKKARAVLRGIDDGHDPVAAKAKARVDDGQRFSVLMEEYLAVRAGDMKPSALEQQTLHLTKHFKALHTLPLRKIDRATVAAELRTISKQRGPVAADRARSTVSAFFGWAIGEGIDFVNPVIGTNKSSKNASRERVLSDAELVAIWNAAGEGEYGRIVKLLMLTGQRRDEIASLRWAEIEDDGSVKPVEGQKIPKVIALPGARTKNNRPHDVAISPQAQAVLDAQPQTEGRALVFGRGQGGFSGYSKPKADLDKDSGVADWTLHDLRRTMATKMANDLGVLPHIIEAILNHVSGHKGGVAGIYNRATYAAEKRAALDVWGNHLQTLLAIASGENVTMLRRA